LSDLDAKVSLGDEVLLNSSYTLTAPTRLRPSPQRAIHQPWQVP
jgi:hypothetical protein